MPSSGWTKEDLLRLPEQPPASGQGNPAVSVRSQMMLVESISAGSGAFNNTPAIISVVASVPGFEELRQTPVLAPHHRSRKSADLRKPDGLIHSAAESQIPAPGKFIRVTAVNLDSSISAHPRRPLSATTIDTFRLGLECLTQAASPFRQSGSGHRSERPEGERISSTTMTEIKVDPFGRFPHAPAGRSPTHTYAKQLVPVANKPVLFYGIEALVRAGVEEIGIIIAPRPVTKCGRRSGTGSDFGARSPTSSRTSRPVRPCGYRPPRSFDGSHSSCTR